MSKPIFFKPIEIINSTGIKRITYSYPSGAPVTYNADLTPGVYSSLPALLKGLSNAGTTAMAGPGITVSWTLTEVSGYYYVLCTTSASVSITLTALANYLGCVTGFTTYGTTHTGTVLPRFTWQPTYQNATQDRWHYDYKTMGHGQLSQTGQHVGNLAGPNLMYRKMRFTNEPARNVLTEASLDAYNPYNNFEYFVYHSMWSAPATTGNVSTRGFFFYPEREDAKDNPTIYPGGSTGISTSRLGVKYDLTSTPDLFTFCQFDDDPISQIKASSPHGIGHYEFDFEMHTIDSMPTWTVTS